MSDLARIEEVSSSDSIVSNNLYPAVFIYIRLPDANGKHSNLLGLDY
jgi:hypothetical protein